VYTFEECSYSGGFLDYERVPSFEDAMDWCADQCIATSECVFFDTDDTFCTLYDKTAEPNEISGSSCGFVVARVCPDGRTPTDELSYKCDLNFLGIVTTGAAAAQGLVILVGMCTSLFRLCQCSDSPDAFKEAEKKGTVFKERAEVRGALLFVIGLCIFLPSLDERYALPSFAAFMGEVAYVTAAAPEYALAAVPDCFGSEPPMWLGRVIVMIPGIGGAALFFVSAQRAESIVAMNTVPAFTWCLGPYFLAKVIAVILSITGGLPPAPLASVLVNVCGSAVTSAVGMLLPNLRPSEQSTSVVPSQPGAGASKDAAAV
jgi:hypothetical protein